MANIEKKVAMVLNEEGMTTSTLAPPPTSAPSLFVVLKQVHPGDVPKDKGSLLAISEANSIMKSPISSASTGIHPTSSMSLSDTATHAENMPADARCKGITVTLDNNSMWNEFCRCQTEMILTKQGRRMFPYCRFRLSGMEPFQSYLLAMDIIPVDNHRYKWSGKGWETNGKADSHVSRLFVHPESPATGLHWMQYPVSFYRLKLCNNTLDQEGHIILHSMHRYLPRLHIIPADKGNEDIQIDRPEVITLSFSHTEFFAVTAYQNLRITQLKIDYNPFAKGFREDAVNARSTKAKNGVFPEETENELKLSKESTTLNNLKTLFMKRSAAAKVNKDQNVPSPTNGEKKVVNGDAPVEDRDKSAKKRPLPGAFSDFLKGAHVKVKRLSLDNIEKNRAVLQTPIADTSGKQEVEVISSNPKEVLQAGETVMDDIHRCNNMDTIPKTDLIKLDENKMVLDEHKDDKITLLPSDQKVQISDEKGKENFSSSDTEAKPEAKTKKTLPHKRPEPVPLPLLAQFLKQRKSKTKSTTPKPEAPSSTLDSKPQLTPESSPDLISSTFSADTHIDSQSSLRSSSQTVISSSTEDANNMTSTSTTSLSSSTLTVDPLIQEEAPLRFSPSSPASDSFLAPNTTSPANPDYDPALDSISEVFGDADVSVQGLDNTLMSQSDISSVFTCNVLDDTDSPTTPAVNTDVAITSDTPTVTTSPVFDVPSSKNNEVVPNQELSSMSQVESESVSDCLLESSNDLCSELFAHDTNDESLSLPLGGSSSPAFSLPSPAPSSPDPFPPDLFSERPLPPRKTLDSFPERLLDCTGIPSSDIFTLFYDIPEAPINHLDSLHGRLMNGSVDLLLPRLQNRPGLFNKSIDLFCQRPSDEPDPVNDIQSTVICESSETAVSDHPVPEPNKQSSHESTLKKSNKKQKKVGKLKNSEDDEMFEEPIPAPMQPSLENVEGQLFVSFTSKTALEIHLGDDTKTESAPKTMENSADGDSRGSIEEKIEALEKDLLHDLKFMKHRQVIHPVLQKVGLKLNLLDHTLAIDLQYLGVQLPIPPPVLLPEESSASSQVQFVSRTGKTTDVTKIKGWRDKFAGSSLSESVGVSSVETGQNNLSAFCSDMLDEYLASEGKLIDERAANLSQTDITPVAYQLPTRSTSYVRTLDSVLKKQVPPSLSSTSKHPSPTSSKAKPMFHSKVNKTSKRNVKSGKLNQVLSTAKPTKPVNGGEKFTLSLSKVQQSKRLERNKIRKESTSLSTTEKVVAEIPVKVASDKTPRIEDPGSTAVSSTGGRSPGLPKTLVKLMDVEDGAVWEGKRRTCITEERAAIALTALVTAESATKTNPDPMRIIKRRAPPCLNVFCRLGCLCGSLLHQRRHHHCGKPECMLGCSCLRRKVIALKRPKEEASTTEEPEPQGLSEENKTKWKKNKRRKTYVLTDPEAAPEPAKRVNTLWNPRREEYDSEIIFCPPLPKDPTPLLSKDLQHDLERFFSPPKQKRDGARNSNMMEESSDMENHLTCSRVRPFRPCHNKLKTPVNHQQVPTQDIEEGELVPLNLSGPIKRLEIISECSWSSTDSRNDVMRMVCKHMAQDRLKNPFWVGKYYIQPVSKTVQNTEEGSVHTFKVNISEPVVKNTEDESVLQNEVEMESIQPVEKIEVKGLPFLARCSPAGLLKAEKKAPNAPGQIMVNGKSYPQAKLELGKMGALHPANRLAAYITGRICPVSQPVSTVVTTSSTAKASTIVPVTSVASVTSVTSTCASTTTLPIKTTVTKPPVGQVFTQFVVNHISSQNQASTSAPHVKSSPPKIVIPSSLVMVGREAGVPDMALSPLKTGLATQVSKPSVSTGSISFPTVSKVQAPTITILNKSPSLPLGGSNVTQTPISSSLSPTSGKKTVLITVVSRKAGPTSSEPQVAKSVTQVRPSQTQGQKMTLQVVKTADGNTLYRNPSGQLVRLVPLSQIKSMNPNFLSKGPTTVFRLPALNVVSPNKPQSANTITVTSSSPTSLTQAKTTVTLPAASSLSSKPVTLTTSKSVSINSLPSTIKVSPTFLGQSGTCTLRILPPSTLKDTGSSTTTSSPSLSQGGFTLLRPTSSTLQNQDSEIIASVSSGSTEGPVSQAQPLLDLSKRSTLSESLAGNESEISSPTTTSPKPTQCSGNASSSSHRDLGELEYSGLDANPNVKEGECDMDQQGEGIGSDGSELTDDSDLYSDDDQEDTYSDSDKEEMGPVEDGLDSEMKDPAEVVVDIESFEESVEKINIALLRESAKEEKLHDGQQKNNDDQKIKKVHKERARRCNLRERFLNLQLTLKNPLQNISKNRILTLAQEEINTLEQQESLLVMNRHKLRIEREQYLQTLSMMSDKSVESISQKLNEIVAKQKALEGQTETREMKSQLKQTKPKPISKPKHFPKSTDTSKLKSAGLLKEKDVVPKPMQSPSKPIDLSLKKQRSLETPGSIEDSTSKPKELDSSKSTPTTPVNNKSSVSTPIQTISKSIHLESAPIPITLSPLTRERMQPNILLRSQTTPASPVKEPLVTNMCIPQVIPLNTMVPCNQIITLNNPLQPISITALGPQQSTTPGVASVSISVPGMPQPLGVENPLPLLQPQFSPVKINTQVEPINLSNVANVISLVPPVDNLVVPQQVVLEKTDTTPAVQTQPISVHSHLEEKEAVNGAPKQPVEGDVLTMSVTPPNQDGLDKKGQENSNDAEDENLMSLLDELVLLSQQLSNDSPEPANEDQNDVTPDKASSQPDHQEDIDQDDDRALSPLFLTLDEDLMSPDCSKDEMDDIPPKVDDLVKVIFGSDSPSVSYESAIGVATSAKVPSPQPPTSSVTSDALTPPPLLHMKAACGAVSGHPASEGANVTWRPMPKLVPLGLKAQDAVLNKVNGSSVLKSDSKAQEV